MELKQYFYIIWKRIWIPIVLVVLVAFISYLTEAPDGPPTYQATMRFIVSVQPERVPDEFNYDGYYANVSSEYLTDDFSVIVSSQLFAEAVNRHLNEMNSSVNVSVGTIQGLLFTERQHRVLTINLTWHNPAELQEIGRAIELALLNEGQTEYLPLISSYGGVVKVIDPPSNPQLIPPPLSERLDLPVRLVLALVAGLGLTILFDYLDDRVQNRQELESLGVPVLAEVTKS